MISNRSELRIASVSDIHLGHKRNSAAEIIANLHCAFPDNAETAELDIIFLAGDVFDTLLSFPSDDVWEINLWMASFLRLCKKHDILLRILEGTPSHDWQQSKNFHTINEASRIGANLQHVTTLSIEYIERYGITVLYVPDEWDDTTDKTLSQVRELLKAKGLTSVDYAIMHGQFSYQLPEFIKAPRHSEEAYLSFVSELIFIGHVHTHSRFDRIIAQGSFDRLSHGEEEPKGHVRVTVKENGERDVVFVENTNAKKMITINCLGLDVENSILRVDKRVALLPPTSYVRLEIEEDHPLVSSMDIMIRRYPMFVWSKLVRENEEEESRIVECETIFVPITITKDNLSGLLMERIINSGASAEVLTASLAILKEVM